jgi:hypothetical protein
MLEQYYCQGFAGFGSPIEYFYNLPYRYDAGAAGRRNSLCPPPKDSDACPLSFCSVAAFCSAA